MAIQRSKILVVVELEWDANQRGNRFDSFLCQLGAQDERTICTKKIRMRKKIRSMEGED